MPEKILCENLPAPAFIDVEKPEISWVFNGPGDFQKQCRLVVSSNGRTLWDSGSIQSAWTRMATGIALEAGREYTMTVYTTDENGCEAHAEERFETGLVRVGDEAVSCHWKAQWISGGSLFRRAFKTRGKVRKARAFVTGLGYFELYINGKKAGDDVLSPSYTNYRHRCEYMAYDVTAMLKDEENTVSIMLGAHWPVTTEDPQAFDHWLRYYLGSLCAILQLEIHYEDGTSDIVASDESFRTAHSPIVISGIYYGEDYDARQEIRGWDSYNFDDRGFNQASVVDSPARALIHSTIPPIKVIEDLSPVSITDRGNGRSIVDFGQNISGIVSISVRGERGRTVKIRTSELVDDHGELNTENLRSARSACHYILKGEGEEHYRPRFTYHGFRYVEVTNWPGTISPDCIAAHVTHSSLTKTGHFECSDTLLNRIHTAMVWTLRTNQQSIPLDCCQRDERQGWMGDAQTSAEAVAANFDMCSYYRKWLDDIADIQDEKGNLGSVYTPCSTSELPYEESFSYKAAYAIIVRLLYREYGDIRSLKKHYPRLKKLAEYLKTMEYKPQKDGTGTIILPINPQGLLKEDDLGDCLSVENVPPRFVRDAYYVDFQHIMADFADILRIESDRAYFTERFQELAQKYQDTHYYGTWYYEDKNHDLGSGYYGSCRDLGVVPGVLVLLFGIAPEKYHAVLLEKILFQVTKSRGSTQFPTGFFGTKLLLDLLDRTGHNAVSMDMLRRRDYPSFNFMLEMGGTTIWERWQYMTGNEMNSHNHTPLAGADSFFYKVLGGINDHAFSSDGTLEIALKPYFDKELDFVTCSREIAGREVRVHWFRTADGISMQVVVPKNAKAVISVPDGYRAETDNRCMEPGIHEWSFKKL